MDAGTAWTLAIAVANWLPFLIVGQVVQLALVRRYRTQTSLTEGEVFLHAPFLSFIGWGFVGTVLAAIGLFRIEAFVFVLVALAWLGRRGWVSYRAVVRALGRRLWVEFRASQWLLASGVFLLAATFFLVLPATTIPEESPDVWVFQIPIARQIVAWSGFRYGGLGLSWPGFSNIHYSNMPLFGNVLYAESLLWRDSFAMASVANLMIFFSALVSICGFAGRRWRGLAIFVLAIALPLQSDFILRATLPLTDLPRSCFTLMAFLFAYRALYVRDRFYVLACGACAGAAMATKYTEVTTGLVCLGFLLGFIFQAKPLRSHAECSLDKKAVAVATAIAAAISCYWYLKNWILLGNPIYPFLFRHPGQSDLEIANFMREMNTALDPALRSLSRNLLTVQGWVDFATIFRPWFWQQLFFKFFAIALLVASLWRKNRLWTLAALNVALFLHFYVTMFNERRWAVAANFLVFGAGWLSAVWLLENQVGPRLEVFWQSRVRVHPRWPAWIVRLRPVAELGVFIFVVGFALSGEYLARRSPGVSARAHSGLSKQARQAHLVVTREGYALAHYAHEHRLTRIWNPLSGPTAYYFSPEPHELGPSDKEIDVFNKAIAPPGTLSEFLREYQPNYVLLPLAVPIGLASQLWYEEIKPRLKLIADDRFGWGLYHIVP